MRLYGGIWERDCEVTVESEYRYMITAESEYRYMIAVVRKSCGGSREEIAAFGRKWKVGCGCRRKTRYMALYEKVGIDAYQRRKNLCRELLRNCDNFTWGYK